MIIYTSCRKTATKKFEEKKRKWKKFQKSLDKQNWIRYNKRVAKNGDEIKKII